MSVIDHAKEIVDIVRKLDNLELYRQVIELEGEIIEQARQIRHLEEKNGELSEKLKWQTEMVFDQECKVYFVKNDRVPFCPRCWEVKKLAVHLVTERNSNYAKCRECQNVYFLGKEPQISVINVPSDNPE